MYSVEFSRRAERQFKKLPADVQSRIARKIDQLCKTPRPRGAEKLQGEDSAYRIRVGEYRILYDVVDMRLIVLVLRIGHRREVYRQE